MGTSNYKASASTMNLFETGIENFNEDRMFPYFIV
jgi:hypothetical protein